MSTENTTKMSWQDFINTLQKANIEAELAAMYSKNNGVGVLSGGGRLGFNYPINQNNSWGLGASGGGYIVKGNTPHGKINQRDFNVNNIDLRYTNGPNTFRGGFGINGNKNWNFNYERSF